MLIALLKVFQNQLKTDNMTPQTVNYIVTAWRNVKNLDEYKEWAYIVRTLMVKIPTQSIYDVMNNSEVNYINSWEKDSVTKEIIDVLKYSDKHR